MKILKKSKILKYLALFSIPMSSLTILINELQKNSLSKLDNQVKEKSLSTDGTYLDSNFETDSNNSISMFRNASGISTDASFSRSGPNYILGPRGVLIANSKGRLSYINESGDQIWESWISIGGYGKRLVGGFCWENIFYCLSQSTSSDGTFQIYRLNESDGISNGSSSNSIKASLQWPDYFMVPISGIYNGSSLSKATSYIFSRSTNNKDNLVKMYDSLTNSFSNVTLDEWNTSWKVMAAGWNDYKNTRVMAIAFYDGSNIKLRYYQNDNSSMNSFVTKSTFDIGGFSNLQENNVITNSPEISVQLIGRSDYDGFNIYTSFVADYYEQQSSLVRIATSGYSWENQIDVTSFDQNGLNIDISNSKLYGKHFYCSASTSSQYSGTQIVKINIEQKSNSTSNGAILESKNYKTDSSVFNGDIAYYNTNFGRVSDSSKIIPVPIGTDPAAADIIAVNCEQNKVQAKNYTNNNYLYKTRLESNEIAISNVSSVNAITLTQDELNASKYIDAIKAKLTQYQANSAISIVKKGNNDSQWSHGKIPVTINVLKGYTGSSKNAENVSFDAVLTGFKIVSTEIKQSVLSSGISVDGEIQTKYADQFVNSSTTSNSDKYNLLKSWICKKTKEIFENYPTEFISDSDISLNISKGTDSTSLSVQITLTRCYVNGDIGSHTFDRITIKGFTQRPETTINTSNINISNDPTLSKKTVDSVTTTDIKNYLWSNKETYFNNIPETASSDSIQVTIDNKQSNSGTLTISVKLTDIYNNSGEHITGEPGIKAQIQMQGFLSENKSTTFSGTETNVSSITELSSMVPTDITSSNSHLKEFIFNNLIQNKAPSTTVSNIVSVSLGDASNTNGTLVINSIVVNKYQDANGVVHNEETTLTGNITLHGFQTRNKTSLISSTVNVISNSELNKKTTDNVTEIEIRNFIFENKNNYLSNIPSNFSSTDIDVVFGAKKSSVGEIEITIYLNKYYDSNGIEQTSNHGLEFSAKVVGLTALNKSTSFSPTKTSVSGTSLASKFPSDVSDADSDLKEFIAQNLLINKPSGFNSSNIESISISNKNNLNGTLTITSFSINKYLDDNGTLINSSKNIPADVQLTGFNSTAPTTLKTSIDVSSDSSLSKLNAIDVTEQNIKDFLYKNRTSVFANLPPSFSSSNISVSIDNRLSGDGKVIANISLNKYYDENGVEKTSPLKQFDSISFFGFVKFDQSTAPSDKTEWDISNTNLSNIIPQDISLDNIELKEFIANNMVVNAPEGYNYENIYKYGIYSYNNLTGEIVIKDIELIGEMLDKNGNLIFHPSGITYSKKFTIKGFKKVKPTTQINNSIYDKNLSKIKISDVTEIEINKIIFDNLSNILSGLPEGIDQSNLKISIDKKEKDSVIVSCELNYYYNEQGVRINNSDNINFYTNNLNYSFNVNISGFQYSNLNNWWILIISITSFVLLILIIWLAFTSVKKSKLKTNTSNRLAPPPKSNNKLNHTPNVKKISKTQSVNSHNIKNKK